MVLYKISISTEVRESIVEYAKFIEKSSGSKCVAAQWVNQVLDEINTLAIAPLGYSLAEENELRDYEIRCLTIGSYLALYHVDAEFKFVYVIGFRHASRQPRPGDLPTEV